MKKSLYLILFSAIVSFTGCSISNMSMKQPNNHIEFYKNDFEYSPQVTGEATSIKVLMIDWARLFKWNEGKVGDNTQTIQPANLVMNAQPDLPYPLAGVISAVIPVLGESGKGSVTSYALYDMMKQHPGYDVVIYPQYETKKFVIPFIYSKTTVKATARLGKIKD